MSVALAMTPTPWLTAEAAAEHLGYATVKALYTAVARGLVPAHRLGRRLRFRRDELDQAVVGSRPRAPSPGRS